MIRQDIERNREEVAKLNKKVISKTHEGRFGRHLLCSHERFMHEVMAIFFFYCKHTLLQVVLCKSPVADHPLILLI